MATLNLAKTWINRMDTGASVAGYTEPERTSKTAVDGEVQTFAGGRQRAITTAGESGTFSFTLVDVSAADKATLELWKRVTVEVRDHRGQRFVGVYFEVTVTEVKSPQLYNLAIELHYLSVPEGV